MKRTSKEPTSINFPLKLKEKVKKYAEKEEMSFSGYIVFCMRRIVEFKENDDRES